MYGLVDCDINKHYFGRMKFVLSVLIFFLPFFLDAQSSSEKVQNAIDGFINVDNPYDGFKKLIEVRHIIEEVNDSLKSNYFATKAIFYGQTGKSDSSFYFLEKAEQLAIKSKSESLQIKINNTRGLVYMGIGDYESSLMAYQQAMDMAKGKKDPEIQYTLRKIYGNLGGIYYQLEQYEKAVESTTKALALSEKNHDSSSQAYNHLRLALVYNDIDKLDEGIFHLNASSQFFESLGDTMTLVYAENTLGRVFEKKGALDSALFHYAKANELALSVGNQEEVAFTLLSMSSIHLIRNEIEEAENYANSALAFAKSKGFANSTKRAYDLLYKCSIERGNYKTALDFRNKFILLSDSINGVEVKERVAELETKYETVEKEAEIHRLALENELKSANLARSRNAQLTIAIGSILVIIVLFLFFSLRSKKQKAEKEAQELQMEALQKRLLDLNATPTDLQINLEDLNSKLQSPLSEREFEALELSLNGKTNAEIAENLFISVSTVKFHFTNIYGKLGVSNRKEALDYVVKKS